MSKETMKAITVYGPHDARMEDVPKPIASGHNMVIKVVRTGVCGTDLSIFSGESSFVKSGEIVYPVRFGHEWAGIVESVGEEVKDFKPGDRVFADNFVTCGKCPACKEHDYMNCVDIRSVGTVHCWDGCFAEYMLMPDWHVFKLPDQVSMDWGALIEPASIAYDAFKDVKLTENDTVVVYGTGSIGLLAVWLAKYYGAKRVILVGRTSEKLEKGKLVGADYVINAKECDVCEQVKKLSISGKGASFVVETCGAPEAFINSIKMCARWGRISVVSFYEQNLDNIPVDHLVLSNLKIVGAAGCYGNAPAVCEIMKNSKVNLDPIISHHIPFKDCLDVFYHKEKYHSTKIKIMVDFD